MKDNNDNTHYLPIFMSVGISVGLAIGAPTGNIPIGMCIGLGAGVCIGGIIDYVNRRSRKSDPENNDDDE